MPAHISTAHETTDGRRDLSAAVVVFDIDFGKRFNTRKGKIVGPLAFDASSQWPWRDPNSGDAWTTKGRFSQDIDSDGDTPDHPNDIVSEYVDVSSTIIPRLVPRHDTIALHAECAKVCHSEPIPTHRITVSVCIGLGTILADVRAIPETGDIMSVDRVEFRSHDGECCEVDASRLGSFAVSRGGAWVSVLDILAVRVREEVSP